MKSLRTRFAAALAIATIGISAQAQEFSIADLAQRTHFHGLAVSAVDPNQLYLATHHGLFVVDMAGQAKPISAVQDFMGFTPHPTDPSILYASGHPASGGNLGFIMSADGGATWTQLSPGLNGPVDFHQMDVSPVDPKVIYGAYGDLQVSRDGGQNWSAAGPSPEALIAIAASGESADRLYAATEAGLFRSDDGAASWSEAAFPSEVVSLVQTGVDGTIFAYVLGRGLMSAKESDLAQWTALNNEFGNQIPLHLAVDAGNPERMFLATQSGALLASSDGGKSWNPLGQE